MGFGRMCHRSTVRQRAASPVRGEVRTELIHQPVGADHATVVDDEKREQRPLLLCPGCDIHSVDHRRERSKDPEGNLDTADPRDPAAGRKRLVRAP